MDVSWQTLNMEEAFLQYASLNAAFSYKQRQAEIAKKNQANAKQHPEVELLTSENY